MALPSNVWYVSNQDASTRSSLIKFWLSCPDDQLQFLWNTPIGSATTVQIKSLTANTVFTQDEIALRNDIGDFFNTHGLSNPLSIKLMIANFLVSPPGLLKINNIESFFPAWFCAIYSSLYATSAPDLQSHAVATDNRPFNQQAETQQSTPSQPDFGPFPGSLQELVGNRIHLNRILGLSNLYYIDPEDSEITNELQLVRSSFAKLILSASTQDLESFWSTEIGERYWALVRSGIQKETLNPSDESIKNSSVDVLNPAKGGGFSAPNAINAFLVSMMYFLPGTMKVSDPESNIPSWLIKPYLDIYAAAVKSS